MGLPVAVKGPQEKMDLVLGFGYASVGVTNHRLQSLRVRYARFTILCSNNEFSQGDVVDLSISFCKEPLEHLCQHLC